MKNLFVAFLFFTSSVFGQLTVEKIMRDQKWIGSFPSAVQWAEDSKSFYFLWNTTHAPADSLYQFNLSDAKIHKLSASEVNDMPAASGVYNKDRSKKVYEKNGDLYLIDCQTHQKKRLTQTIESESQPVFLEDETKLGFVRNSNVYVFDLLHGTIQQITHFVTGSAKIEPKPSDQDAWLQKDQLDMFSVLKERKEKTDLAEKLKKGAAEKRPKAIYLEDKTLDQIWIDPSLETVFYRLSSPNKSVKNTIVPSFVTESGYTEDVRTRPKVGHLQTNYESFIYQIEKDTVIALKTQSLSGLKDKPDFYKNYPKLDTLKNFSRKLVVNGPIWGSKNPVVVVRSLDNKDRWIALVDKKTGLLKQLDRQRDEAWIGGPGMGFTLSGGNIGFINDSTIFYQSEETGYSHLYTQNVFHGKKKALTQGQYEVQVAQLLKDKNGFYLQTNDTHPGEQNGYLYNLSTGTKSKITSQLGGNEVSLSPNEKWAVIRHSEANKPWELYLRDSTGTEKQITFSTSAEFKNYAWRVPEVTSFMAKDGQEVYARVYKPDPKLKNKKIVVFVHGAGYLQNAHKWWSQYQREYMFHNLLVDKGYTVFDIDYRASAGYGRNVRTGIYRYMGGKDLSDQIDGVEVLSKRYGVDPKRAGIYGGSYGGFITLMALFTQPDFFAAGAALRPVTDWAAYNHGYTANILNEPALDPISYKKSSPIYFAHGLKKPLLICHGMIDVNVHFQDVARLQQRLIELGKDHFELAAYPLEDHGFVEPSSWTDEYKRILRLFEENL